jgi:RNA polymerase sigma-B factor
MDAPLGGPPSPPLLRGGPPLPTNSPDRAPPSAASTVVSVATQEREARRTEDRRLCDRYRRTRDPAVRETIVRRFLPLVRSLARRYSDRNEPFDDLMQVGSIGLLKAIERFDPDRQIAFSSFAVPTILGEIKRHFRDRTWSVKVPRGAQEKAARVGRVESDLEASLGRSPTTAEIAAALQIGVEDVLDARSASLARSTKSLDSPYGEDRDGQRGIDVYQIEETGFAAAEDAAMLDGLLTCLDARQREVLRLRFEEDLTQAEIGARVGCSQMHASRLIRGAIARLAAAQSAQSGRNSPVDG